MLIVLIASGIEMKMPQPVPTRNMAVRRKRNSREYLLNQQWLLINKCKTLPATKNLSLIMKRKMSLESLAL